MEIITERLEVSTRGNDQLLDLTEKVDSLVRQHGLREGQALIFVEERRSR